MNLCFTARDRLGWQAVAPNATFAALKPFIDSTGFAAKPKPKGARR